MDLLLQYLSLKVSKLSYFIFICMPTFFFSYVYLLLYKSRSLCVNHLMCFHVYTRFNSIDIICCSFRNRFSYYHESTMYIVHKRKLHALKTFTLLSQYHNVHEATPGHFIIMDWFHKTMQIKIAYYSK